MRKLTITSSDGQSVDITTGDLFAHQRTMFALDQLGVSYTRELPQHHTPCERPYRFSHVADDGMAVYSTTV